MLHWHFPSLRTSDEFFVSQISFCDQNNVLERKTPKFDFIVFAWCDFFTPCLFRLIQKSSSKEPQEPQSIFWESIKDQTVHEGEPATFTAILRLSQDALRDAHAQWYFEDDPIEESDIYKITATSGGIHSLHLPEAFPEDAGKYILEIEFLENGEKCYEETSAYLKVEGGFKLQ